MKNDGATDDKIILQPRFTLRGEEMREEVPLKKLSLYGKMTLAYFGDIEAGHSELAASIVKNIRTLFLEVLNSSYLHAENERERKYYERLISQREALPQFLLFKVNWLYRKIIENFSKFESKEDKKILFHRYLVGEIVTLIKYFEEYLFIEEHRKGDNFDAVINRYKPILLWGVQRYKGSIAHHDEMDMYQEFSLVLLDCVSKWQSYPSDSSKRNEALSFGAYFKRSLRNRVIDIYRAQSTQKRKIARFTITGFIDGDETPISRLVNEVIVQNWLEHERNAEEE